MLAVVCDRDMKHLVLPILALAFIVSLYQGYRVRVQLAGAIADREAAIDVANDYAEQANLNAAEVQRFANKAHKCVGEYVVKL